MINISSLKQDRRVLVPAAIITLVLTIALPILVHLIPPVNGVPWGARLIPIFYAPFVAAMLFHPAVSLLAALFAPILNYLLTGSPTLEMAYLLSFELLVFSLLVVLLAPRLSRLPITGLLGFLLAKVAALVLLTLLPGSLIPLETWMYFRSSLVNALPGMLVLVGLNYFIISRLRPTGSE